ncbi:hypothetical protein PVAND_010717 [Polypedilum vanderplanki]|uniref:C-type lectin domain-containing protein n=1 Tax=Polypedilum vanderplanki TaxID=319348 RepID=A0A9J6CGF3_POLVA|nr:hypothetical protein PVAND_010717 [Polypedilum vanderplanki]
MRRILFILLIFQLIIKIKSSKDFIEDVAFIKLGSFHGLDNKGSEYKKTFFIPRHFRTSWVNSRSICKSYGFDIASFETLQEANAVMSFCKNHSDSLDYWTYVGGISLKARSTKNWYWVNSGRKISFEIPFARNAPDFAGSDEWCLALGPKATFDFNDVNCNGYEFKFICQRINFML